MNELEKYGMTAGSIKFVIMNKNKRFSLVVIMGFFHSHIQLHGCRHGAARGKQSEITRLLGAYARESK